MDTENTPVTENVQQPQYEVGGILEILEDGFGFLRTENYLAGQNDVYISSSQIRRFGMRVGDFVTGTARDPRPGERSMGLLQVSSVNGKDPELAKGRPRFDSMTPTFPVERFDLSKSTTALRMIDLLAPIGKGQRGLIVSPPKAGKTTLLKDLAVTLGNMDPNTFVIVLLVDERPEEVTDIREVAREGNIDVVFSTFDEYPSKHIRIADMTLERAKRMVESGWDVVILLDSITRLARAHNIMCEPSGRTLSGGLDPNSLYDPKRFFGAARNLKEGASLTIIATALVDTGSRMDDVIFEEFKGTGNMEVILDRDLQERRIFPAIDVYRSGTRKEELLLTPDELKVASSIRQAFKDQRKDVITRRLIGTFDGFRDNRRLVEWQISRSSRGEVKE